MGAAIEHYTFATEMDPTNHIFFTNRAAAYAHMKKWDKSLRDSNKSIKLKSDWHKGYWRKGNALMALNRAEEAVDAFKMACQLDPENQTYKNLLSGSEQKMFSGMGAAERLKKEGNALFKNGQMEEAIKVYSTAIAKCGEDAKEQALKADLYANRAACHKNLYHPQNVIEDCTAALDINPMHVKSLIRRAQSYEAMEKMDLALKDFDQANLFAPGTQVSVAGATRVRGAIRRRKKETGGK
jgi:stress-induced-phosphoprotein 1